MSTQDEKRLQQLMDLCQGLVDHGYAETLTEAAEKLMRASTGPITTPLLKHGPRDDT